MVKYGNSWLTGRLIRLDSINDLINALINDMINASINRFFH